ncbi:hypothetical protein VX037_17490 [Gordonia sp. Z-3]|uniref:DUF222 domain-containing protein n=1 Tax=Gordonia tangerina TaxID=2911060 RepID=A0ABS9DGA1_9ACTN|nr:MULTISPECIES: hypothetical protein [Gordonia]MCF3937334.1 hypothetical protein [Gordonia tangerina]MED5802824.1 hypothetical protein [Gordonia sp. Z-3]
MFSFTDHDADDTVLSAPLDGVAEQMAYAEGVRDTLRLSRQSEARTVLGAGMIGDRAYNDRMNGQGPHANSGSHTKAHKFAIGEISLQLGITRGKAGEWASLAHMLADLPKIRLAYLAGDFSTHRVTELATSSQTAPKGNLRPRLNDILDEALGPRPDIPIEEPTPDADACADSDASVDADASADNDACTDDDPDTGDAVEDHAPEDPAQAPVDFEDIALELAYRPTPDTVLRDELDSALISLDPDAHAQAREDVAQAFQNVTFAKEAFGHMQMSACLSAEHAIHLQHRIADLIAERVCRRDPRRVGHRRAIALAEIHSVPDTHLHCECGYDTCTARTRKQTADTTPPVAVDDATPSVAVDDDDKVTPETTATHTADSTDSAEPAEPDTTTVEPSAAQSHTAETTPDPTSDDPGDGSESTRPWTARCDAPTPDERASSHTGPDHVGSAHNPTEADPLAHHHAAERTVDNERSGHQSPLDAKQHPVNGKQHPLDGKRRPLNEKRRPVDVRRVRWNESTPAVLPPTPAVLESRCAGTPRAHRIVRYRDYRCRHP